MFAKFHIEKKRKAEIVRFIRQAVVLVVPVVGLFVFAGLLAWTFRRQVMPLREAVVAPEIEADVEIGPDVTPV